MLERLRSPVPGFDHRIEGQRDAVREQRLAAGLIEVEKEVPEFRLVIGQVTVPSFVALGDLLRPGRLGQSIDLAEAAALQADLQARVRREAIEDLQHEGMECRDEGDVDVTGERVAHRQRPLRGQVEDEAIGQRLDAVVLGLVIGSTGRPDPPLTTASLAIPSPELDLASPFSCSPMSSFSVRGSSSESTKPASTWSLPFAASVTNTPAMAFWTES